MLGWKEGKIAVYGDVCVCVEMCGDVCVDGCGEYTVCAGRLLTHFATTK